MRFKTPLTVVVIGVLVMSTKEAESARPSCPANMVEVRGAYCPQVQQSCLEWVDAPTSEGWKCNWPESDRPRCSKGTDIREPRRCAKFGPSVCLSSHKVRMHYCIDRYEAGLQKGELPPVGISWTESVARCKARGAHLCTVEEFNFACEGEKMLPYTYGYDRDVTACNIDSPKIATDPPRSKWPELYDGRPAGSMDRCVSSFGVYDMNGNLDEWVDNTRGHSDRAPYRSGLKGGYWGPVRTRCRPMTVAHGPGFEFYQITAGRCCQDLQR